MRILCTSSKLIDAQSCKSVSRKLSAMTKLLYHEKDVCQKNIVTQDIVGTHAISPHHNSAGNAFSCYNLNLEHSYVTSVM